MSRFTIINSIIKKYNFKKYLEIGYQRGVCFNKIDVEYKKAIDPAVPNKENVYHMTSDNYFFKYNEKFDIIFIDGLHTYEQVLSDFKNSLNSLNDGGVIVFHDMNPTSEERGLSFKDGGVWNGDCYKVAIDIYNGLFENEYYTVDDDQGCLVLYKDKKRKVIKNNIKKDYKSFKENNIQILNLISINEFKNNKL